MADENEDWSIPDRFMSLVYSYFNINNCQYGQIIYHEMKGHRIGDRLLISNNYRLQSEMLDHYKKAQSLAVKNKSWKHTFTPFFWVASYFEKFDKLLAVKYHAKSLKMMEKYCPDARLGYRQKAIQSLRYLKRNLSKKEWGNTRKWLLKCKKKCLVKVRKQFK